MKEKTYRAGQNHTAKQPPVPGTMAATEKAKNLSGTFLKLIKHSRCFLPAIVTALACAVIGTLLALVGPDKLSEMTDLIAEGLKADIDMDAITSLGSLLVFLYLGSAVLTCGQNMIMARVTQEISRNLRTDISRKINRLPMAYFERAPTGDVLSRVTNDVDTIGQALNQSVGNLASAVAMLTGCVWMMLRTNLAMTTAAVASALIGFAFMARIMRKSQEYFLAQQNCLGEINGYIEEIYAGHTVVKAYNGARAAAEVFDHMNKRLEGSGRRAQALSGLMMPFMSFIGNFGYVAVCIVGALLTMSGQISFGVIVAFMLYVRYFTNPLSQISQAVQSLQSAAAAGERVFEFLEAEEMEDESEKPLLEKKLSGKVDFSHLRFGYSPDVTIIQDFSASVKSGQKIAIVGPTGAGKTTIVNLLMRFYELDGGAILLDGVPESQMRREEIHNQFCMVLQDTWLFAGSIRENLVYNGEDCEDTRLDEVCEAVGLSAFIRSLPQGYDTVLDDHVALSQGQKQQMTIARAMLSDRPMLILDEATSSVDTRTEQKIQSAMDILMRGRTSFVIAHRLSTIKNADLILVLKDGNVIERGTHEELLRKKGFYAELYNSQFKQVS